MSITKFCEWTSLPLLNAILAHFSLLLLLLLLLFIIYYLLLVVMSVNLARMRSARPRHQEYIVHFLRPICERYCISTDVIRVWLEADILPTHFPFSSSLAYGPYSFTSTSFRMTAHTHVF